MNDIMFHIYVHYGLHYSTLFFQTGRHAARQSTRDKRKDICSMDDFKWDYTKAVQRLYGKSINTNIVCKTLNGVFSLCVCVWACVRVRTNTSTNLDSVYLWMCLLKRRSVSKKGNTK